jgi:hypothetical protein
MCLPSRQSHKPYVLLLALAKNHEPGATHEHKSSYQKNILNPTINIHLNPSLFARLSFA